MLGNGSESHERLGFTDVKFWVQWRWNNRRENEYDFGDLDRLTDLAEKNGLRVTFNTIFDVAPVWLYEKYPDAKQLANDGRRIEPYTVGHRQGGGHPGPCYNHPGALEARKAFMRQAILHFRDRKGVRFWDVWNEPELSFPQRDAQLDRLVCYCDHCRAEFIGWLQRKYRDIETLNRIWGRCYNDWEEVELPRNTETIKDFIDWRLFHSYTMTREAQWRLEMVRELAPEQAAYLHVVPNTMQPFNAVSTCTDDFAVAEMCDVFAATMNNGPFFTPQVLSAAGVRYVTTSKAISTAGELRRIRPCWAWTICCTTSFRKSDWASKDSSSGSTDPRCWASKRRRGVSRSSTEPTARSPEPLRGSSGHWPPSPIN
ncbi:beta-galactosidase [Alistipes sp. AF48-12]|uniref:beta-galactosidase n=1 Tax=Alistipes sp. AF48-12 TaxID=2291998 RepID=UPI002175068B|nr:beta-galactosidase [Alistipes sp. AF48-12]